eukprot:275605-Pelagomonas_calceolata.AAC.8
MQKLTSARSKHHAQLCTSGGRRGVSIPKGTAQGFCALCSFGNAFRGLQLKCNEYTAAASEMLAQARARALTHIHTHKCGSHWESAPSTSAQRDPSQLYWLMAHRQQAWPCWCLQMEGSRQCRFQQMDRQVDKAEVKTQHSREE